MACDNKLFNGNLIPVTGGNTAQKVVIVQEGAGINVTDLSDSNTYKFTVSSENVTALTVTLALISQESSTPISNPVLIGTVIDEVNLSWTYNKTIVSQTLENTGGLTPPTLINTDVLYDYTGQTITANTSFTIEGNDGLALSGSIANDTKSITFGNYLWVGAGTSKISTATASIEAFIETLTSTIKTSRAHTYYATGGVNQKQSG